MKKFLSLQKTSILFLLAFNATISNAQYVDTIKSRVHIKCNNPSKFFVSLNGGAKMVTHAVDGGYMHPQAFAELTVKPLNFVVLNAVYTKQYNFGWRNQEVADNQMLDAAVSLFITNKTIRKQKVFTAGSKKYNYDFFSPVKVKWNTGFITSYKQGTDIFNTGKDKFTGVRLNSSEVPMEVIKEQVAIPFTFKQVGFGFVVNTASKFKIDVQLPDGKTKTRRMNTYTQFSVQALYGLDYQMANTIQMRENENSTNLTTYAVNPGKISPWGFKAAGTFNRKWISLKVETGVRPGAYQRFSASENSCLGDRGYMSIGLGFGWM